MKKTIIRVTAAIFALCLTFGCVACSKDPNVNLSPPSSSQTPSGNQGGSESGNQGNQGNQGGGESGNQGNQGNQGGGESGDQGNQGDQGGGESGNQGSQGADENETPRVPLD